MMGLQKIKFGLPHLVIRTVAVNDMKLFLSFILSFYYSRLYVAILSTKIFKALGTHAVFLCFFFAF
jgi:hypothetical protein